MERIKALESDVRPMASCLTSHCLCRGIREVLFPPSQNVRPRGQPWSSVLSPTPRKSWGQPQTFIRSKSAIYYTAQAPWPSQSQQTQKLCFWGLQGHRKQNIKNPHHRTKFDFIWGVGDFQRQVQGKFYLQWKKLEDHSRIKDHHNSGQSGFKVFSKFSFITLLEQKFG